MKSYEELEIEKQLSVAEARLVAANAEVSAWRQALAIFKTGHRRNGDAGNATDIVATKDLRRRRGSGGGIRAKVREAVAKLGDKFTPTDVEDVLRMENNSIPRTRLTTNLNRLKYRNEIFVVKDGKGGVEPVYSKTKQIEQAKMI